MTMGFFQESLTYFKVLETQRFLATDLGCDPELQDKGHRRAYYDLVARKTGYDSRTADRWVERSLYPKFDELESVCVQRNLDLAPLDLLDRSRSMRFAIWRTTGYINAFPWRSLPGDDPEYFRRIRGETMRIIARLPFIKGDVRSPEVYTKQPVFDLVVAENSEAIPPPQLLGPLKSAWSRRGRPAPAACRNYYDSFKILLTLLILGDFSDHSVDFSWVADTSSPNYSRVWGYE